MRRSSRKYNTRQFTVLFFLKKKRRKACNQRKIFDTGRNANRNKQCVFGIEDEFPHKFNRIYAFCSFDTMAMQWRGIEGCGFFFVLLKENCCKCNDTELTKKRMYQKIPAKKIWVMDFFFLRFYPKLTEVPIGKQQERQKRRGKNTKRQKKEGAEQNNFKWFQLVKTDSLTNFWIFGYNNIGRSLNA